MMLVVSDDPYAAAAASAARLTSLGGQADVAVVLGSGWAPAADAIGTAEAEVPLTELGGFPEPTVAGHVLTVRYVSAGTAAGAGVPGPGAPVRGMAARHGGTRRAHGGVGGLPGGGADERGRRPPARACARAAGADQRSPQPDRRVPADRASAIVGRRFTDLTGLYSPRLRALAREADPSLAEGVYAMLPGPHYETPAEIIMLGRLGADLVGMSTALEAIAARQLGAEVLGLSLVTNLAAGLAGHGLSHAEVVAAGRASASRMGALLGAILPGSSGARGQPGGVRHGPFGRKMKLAAAWGWGLGRRRRP